MSNYLDNEEFYAALVEYKQQCDLAGPDNAPRVSNYIGDCIIKIATGMARRPNFSGYSWKDEMIGDAIETCLKYIDKFDTANYKNPHAYFSQCCWYCFIGRITLEKKQMRIKRALVNYANVDTMSLQEHDDGEFVTNLNDFITSLGNDEAEAKKDNTQKIGPLDGFFGEVTE